MSTAEQTAVVNLQARTNIAACTDPNSLRWSLANVQAVSNGEESYLRASDGRICACVASEQKEEGELNVLIPKEAIPGKAGKDRWVRVDVAGREAKGPKGYAKLADGMFPKVGGSFPEKLPNSTVITLDAKLLLQLTEALTTDKKDCRVTLFIPEDTEGSAIVVESCGDRVGFGVIMPCNNSADKHEKTHERYEAFVGVQRELDNVLPTL